MSKNPENLATLLQSLSLGADDFTRILNLTPEYQEREEIVEGWVKEEQLTPQPVLELAQKLVTIYQQESETLAQNFAQNNTEEKTVYGFVFYDDATQFLAYQSDDYVTFLGNPQVYYYFLNYLMFEKFSNHPQVEIYHTLFKQDLYEDWLQGQGLSHNQENLGKWAEYRHQQGVNFLGLTSAETALICRYAGATTSPTDFERYNLDLPYKPHWHKIVEVLRKLHQSQEQTYYTAWFPYLVSLRKYNSAEVGDYQNHGNYLAILTQSLQRVGYQLYICRFDEASYQTFLAEKGRGHSLESLELWAKEQYTQGIPDSGYSFEAEEKQQRRERKKQYDSLDKVAQLKAALNTNLRSEA